MEDPMVIEVDLKPYLIKIRDYFSPGGNGYRWAIPSDAKIGKRAAKDCDLVKRLPHTTKIVIRVEDGVHIEYPHGSFWKGLLGPSARKLGTKHIKQLIEVVGHRDLYYIIHNYLTEEQARLDKKVAKKAKEAAIADPTNWTDPVRFFVPEIGTHLRLTQDWTFNLHQERRNEGIITLLNLWNGKTWTHYQEIQPPPDLIKILTGAELTVDRIYIRKGIEEYSSLTFWLGKGAVIVDENGVQHETKKKIRFWAKLEDCNRIQGVIAKASVPGLD